MADHFAVLRNEDRPDVILVNHDEALTQPIHEWLKGNSLYPTVIQNQDHNFSVFSIAEKGSPEYLKLVLSLANSGGTWTALENEFIPV